MPELPDHVPINRQRTPCATKNDKLGWKDGFSLKLEGISFGVRSNSPQLLSRLKALFPAHATDDDTKEVEILLSFMEGGETGRKGTLNYHLVYDAWNRVARTLEFDEAIAAFESTIKARVATLSKEKTYLDAAVVAWGDRAVMVVGETEQRQELVDAMVAQGGTSYCGQAVLDENQRLESCGASAGPSLAPALAVFAEKAESKKPRQVKLTPARTALELFRHARAARFLPQKTLSTLANLSQNLAAYQARVGPPADLARFVQRQLG